MGKAKIVKVNTEEAFNIPAKYSVRGIPTLLLFNQGKVTSQVVGAVEKSVLTEMLDNALENS